MRILTLLAVVACKGGNALDTDLQPVTCDPVVTRPGILGGDPTSDVDPHADTLGAAPGPYHVHYNWPSPDPSTSAAFLWRTDLDTLASVIEYGTGDALTERVEGASFRYGGGAGNPGNYRIHEVKLCGALEPATTYRYRVGGEGAWSDEYSFTTPGAPGTFDSFRFGIAGDSRGAYEVWATLLQKMEAFDPDFIVFTGDMVELGPNQGEWDAWFTAAGDLFARKAFVPAHGNHEFLTQHYFAQFSLPNNEQWFHVNYGPMTLVSLNDTVTDTDYLHTVEPAYMDANFDETGATWHVAMHHQSIYSTCTTHGSYEALRESWGPAFDRNDVDLVLAGHNHIYERSVPIRDEAEVAPGEGTVYLVSGGAGAPLYTEIQPEWFGLVANPVEHYAIADVSSAGIHITVRDLADNVIDEFTLPPR